MLRKLSIVVLLVVVLAVPTYAQAPTYNGYPVVNVLINEQTVQADVPAIVMDGRTLLPVRAVAQALGAQVEWDQETQTVKMTAPDAAGLKKQLEDATKGRDAALATVSSLQSQVANSQSQLTSAQNQVTSLQGQVSALQNQVQDLTGKLQSAQAQVQKLQAALGSTPVTSGTVVKMTDLPVTVTAVNGMVLTVNSITSTASALTLNITVKNNGGATGDAMFSSSEVQAGSSKLTFVSQDQVFYDNFLSFRPGMKITGNVVFSAVPSDVSKVTWYFDLQSGTNFEHEQLTFALK